MKEDSLKITAGEPTPMQLVAWQRLWALLLAPVESKSPATVNECGAESETATPGGKGRAHGDKRDGQDERPNEG